MSYLKHHDYERKCPVLGCDNSTKSANCRFFRFPRKNKEYGHLAKIWSVFTRRKNFKPNSVEVMCEIHFNPDSIKTGKRRKQGSLKIGAVPTIYYRNGEKVVIPFDAESQQYYGSEASQLITECEDFVSSHENDFVELRLEKVKTLKNLCRFCFENSSKTVSMTKLEAFSIDSKEFLNLVGVNSLVDIFSEIICEKCFKLIIEFDGYRKRCQKTQQECILELEEFDRKILEIRSEKDLDVEERRGSEVWFKVKIGDENECMDYEEVNVKDDALIENDESFNDPQTDFDETITLDETNWIDDENLNEFDAPAKKKVFRKDPDKQKKYTAKYALRSFECFWCHVLLKGYTAYKTHRKTCKREIRCETVGCRKIFNNQGLYNLHITKRHGLEKITRYFCNVCNVNFQCNFAKFEEHCRKCLSENQFKEQKIECGICKQTFNSLQAFTAHKIFHGPDDSSLVQMMQPKRGPAADDKNKAKKRVNVVKVKEVICDICGKLFGNPNKLRRHHVDVHFVDFNGELYCCDLCPVAKPTRRLIYTHMKSTHMIKKHSCEVCGKEFKNRELWRKHSLIHDESKRSNFCHLCPHQPGFVTKSNLKKHHWKHHGGEQPARPFICDLCGAAYSLEHLVVRHKMKVHNF